ncbi:MAG: hypothetical protein LBQ54_12180 [Planctomycetaceae bacterium]|jgi:hypothetical protein|nr:hypothetical protein [Planctomycetaceae bacterium]
MFVALARAGQITHLQILISNTDGFSPNRKMDFSQTALSGLKTHDADNEEIISWRERLLRDDTGIDNVTVRSMKLNL